MKKKRLNDFFPDWTAVDGGIFDMLLQEYDLPWRGAVSSYYLDLEYFGNRSGSKLPSPLLYRLVGNNAVSKEIKTHIAGIIWSLYGKRWDKLYATMALEYNPIENYRMTEEGTDTATGHTQTDESGTVSKSLTHEGQDIDNIDETDIETPQVKTTKTGTGNATQDKSVYAFNSDEPVPSEKQVGVTSTTDTETHEGTNNMRRTGNDIHKHDFTDTGSDQHSVVVGQDRTDETQHKLTRSGNIGVTTSQQMIQSERDLWLWEFFEIVFADIDRVLTIPVY